MTQDIRPYYCRSARPPFELRAFTAVVVKRNKRLFIEEAENGIVLYTPPDFIREKIHSRQQLKDLCNQFMVHRCPCIKSIMNFEGKLLHGE